MDYIKRRIVVFDDGEIGYLRKSGGTYEVRSESHYISLNTSDRETAEKEYLSLCNDEIDDVQP